MFKSIPLGACLMCMAALIGVETASARTGGVSAPAVGRQPTEFSVLASSTINLVEETLSQMLGRIGAANTVQSADSGLNVLASLLPTIWSARIDSGNQNNDDGKGKDKGKDPHAPPPAPEPSTLLSFGVAVVIGACVFLLGRLRKVRM